ncbi:hypothetical protein K7H09_23740 [Halomonas sp. IOP_14]|uniref:hypothetical protein n=1 Tax=Halomonas sp. IOP_14 TaxID=2873295 RepID=UPI001E3769B5|nr:hypothetical protein [Halomonas sp. IOP_14]MCD1589016.1 hypothetical protein [Halomonas sp. IOP_14]
MKNITLFTLSVSAFIFAGSVAANPAAEYDHPACVQEKVDAHLVLFSVLTLDRYSLGDYYRACALPYDEDAIYPPAPEECIDAKIDSFRKSEGQETPIRHDVLEEWRVECLDDQGSSIDSSAAIDQEAERQRAAQEENERQQAAQAERERLQAQEESGRELRNAIEQSFERSRLEKQRQAAIDANAPTMLERLQALASLSSDVEVGWKSNGVTTWLEITAIEDRVVLRDIVVNRGNCRSTEANPTIRYDFGDKARVSIGCSVDALREVEVTTNRGTFVFNF